MKRYLTAIFLSITTGIFAQSSNTNTAAGYESLHNNVFYYNIQSVHIVSSSGYLYPTLSISGGGGTGLELGMEVTVFGCYVYLVNSGSGYTEAPTITITGGHGTGATVGVDFYDGQIQDVYMIDAGQGYAPWGFNSSGGGQADISTSVNPDGTLSGVLDYQNSPFYAVPTISFQFGNAVAEAVLSTEPINGENTALGYRSMYSNLTGSGNTAIGYRSLFNNIDGAGNIANGTGALESNVSGSFNIAVGSFSLNKNTYGYDNIAIGSNTLRSNIGYNNIGIGSNSLYNNTSGYYNIALGGYALKANTTGYYNTAIGNSVLEYNKTGRLNLAAGYQAMQNNDSGSGNTALGIQSLFYNKTGVNNVAMGQSSMFKNTSGYYNVSVGYSSLYNISDGYFNTVLGKHSGFSVTTGYRNTIMGAESGGGLVSGSNNTLIGAGIGVAENLSNTVILADGTGSQRFYSPSSGNVLFGFGNNPADNGYKIDVNGTGRFTNHLTLGAEPATSTSTYDLLTRNSATGVIEKISSNSIWHSGNFNPAGYISNGGIGDWQIASASNNPAFNNASLELREANYGLQGSIAPRLSFHWGNVAASQIGIESSGRIAVLNNPGDGYEDFIARDITSSGVVTAINRVNTSEIAFRNSDGGDDSDPYRLRKVRGGANANWLELQLNDDNDESFRIYGNSCVGLNCAEYSSNLYHSFDASGNVFHKGKIGIGTDVLTECLNVNGFILAKGVKVNPNAFPDYVFKPGYRLRSLSEVENFIKANSHLPDLPPEADVKKNGVELSEMSIILLKKIEELTLYMIEKDKQLEAADKRIEELAKKIEAFNNK